MARIIALWIFGLLASGIFGALIGPHLHEGLGGLFGILGGMFAFACARLWLAEPSNRGNE